MRSRVHCLRFKVARRVLEALYHSMPAHQVCRKAAPDAPAQAQQPEELNQTPAATDAHMPRKRGADAGAGSSAAAAAAPKRRPGAGGPQRQGQQHDSAADQASDQASDECVERVISDVQ